MQSFVVIITSVVDTGSGYSLAVSGEKPTWLLIWSSGWFGWWWCSWTFSVVKNLRHLELDTFKFLVGILNGRRQWPQPHWPLPKPKSYLTRSPDEFLYSFLFVHGLYYMESNLFARPHQRWANQVSLPNKYTDPDYNIRHYDEQVGRSKIIEINAKKPEND